MAKPSKKVLLPLAVLAVAILIALVLIKTKPKAKPVVIQEKAWPVATVPARLQRLSPELTLYGRVEAQWDSRLSAAVAADVAEVPAREGDEVETGTLLVRLDDAEVRLRLAQADARIASEQARHTANLEALPREQNQLSLLQKELKRTLDLLKKKLASQSALDSARQAVDRQAIAVSNREQSILEHDAKMAELQAARDQAQIDLDRTRVRAPFSGRIAQLNVSPGQRVRVGDALLSIYDTSKLLVRAQIPESQLGLVRRALAAGQQLSGRGELDGQPFQAILERLAGEVGQSGSVAGLFHVQHPDNGMRPGRFVQLSLQLPAQDGLLALPSQALYGLDRVYVVDAEQRLAGRAVSRVGELQQPDGTSLLLLRSMEIQPGEAIVVTQMPNAAQGLKVEVVSSDG